MALLALGHARGAGTVVLADGRVALVVGNSTYAHIGRLPNPHNDAADMFGDAAAARIRGDDRAGHPTGWS